MRVLISIPNYNNANYICQTIDSVLLQKFSLPNVALDIVVFDNKSTDRSVSVIKEVYKEKVLVIEGTENVGAIANHNNCLNYAKANSYDFLKVLSSDDVLLPNILNTQLSDILSNQNIPLVTCNMIITDDLLGNGEGYDFYSEFAGGKVISGDHVISLMVRSGLNLVGGPSNFFIRVSMIGDAVFDKNFKYVSDLKFAAELIKNSSYINSKIYGFYYRRHPKSDTAKINKIRRLIEPCFFSYEFGGVGGFTCVYFSIMKRVIYGFIQKCKN